MKKSELFLMTVAVLFSVFFYGSAFAAAPSLRLTVNGSGGVNFFTDVTKVTTIRFGLTAGDAATKPGDIYLRHQDPRDYMQDPATAEWIGDEKIYIKPTAAWPGGYWADAIGKTAAVAALADIANSVIFQGALSPGTHIFTAKLITGGKPYTKTVYVYSYGNDPAVPNTTFVGDFIRLVSSVKDVKTGEWTYNLEADGKYFKVNSGPFCAGEFTGSNWPPISIVDTDANGRYEFAIKTYNRDVQFGCGGSYASNWVKNTMYNNPAIDNINPFFHNGMMFVNGQQPTINFPGTGDEWLRYIYDPVTKKLRIYGNMQQVVGSLARPYYTSNINNWGFGNMAVPPDSNGWTYFEVTVVGEMEIRLAYGGDSAQGSWAQNVNLSEWYSIKGNEANLCLKANAITDSVGKCQ